MTPLSLFVSHLARTAVGIIAAAAAGLTPLVAQAADKPPLHDAAKLCAGESGVSGHNCRFVVRFYDQVFNQHDLAAAERLIADDYVQHNPDVPNGRPVFLEFFKGYFQENPTAFSAIKRVSASGDLVWLHINDKRNAEDPGNAVVDLFRVRNGRIVEHWDVIQPVVSKTASGNSVF